MIVQTRFSNLIYYITLFWLLLLFGGCGKPVSYGAAQFVTNPAGAEVVNLRDDTNLGTTPLQVFWESNDGKPEHVTIQFRKRGYLEKIVSLWVNTRHDSREAALLEPQPIRVDLVKRK